MNQQSHLRPVESSDDGGAAGNSRQPRQRAARALPTDRMKMDRQKQVLAALGRLSGPRKEPVSGDQLSKAIGGVVAATVILSNRFFADAGWIELSGRGKYAATDELVEYTRRLGTGSSERAVEVLREPTRRSWFWQVLEPYLTHGPLPVNEAAILLMREAGAMDHHMPMIQNLLSWLGYIGLIKEQGDQIVAAGGDNSAEEAGPADAPADVQRPADQQVVTGTVVEDAEPSAQTEDASAVPVVMFSLDVRLTVDDLAQLSAEQIKAFFEAVGALAAVKNRG